MVKSELGTKRIDPETGRKFYDLNRDPIISPYTGVSYPRSYFETSVEVNDNMNENELDTVLEKPEFIALEGVEDDGKDNDLQRLRDEDGVDLNNEDEDTFLPDDDVSGLIRSNINSDNDN